MKIELNRKFIRAKDRFVAPDGKARLITTPPLDKDYWSVRVPLSKSQAIVAFPKFLTIGIGFQIEKASWTVSLQEPLLVFHIQGEVPLPIFLTL